MKISLTSCRYFDFYAGLSRQFEDRKGSSATSSDYLPNDWIAAEISTGAIEYRLVPTKETFQNAIKICSSLDSVLPEIRNSNDNDFFVRIGKSFTIGSLTRQSRIWIGQSLNPVTRKWFYNSNNEVIKWHKWLKENLMTERIGRV